MIYKSKFCKFWQNFSYDQMYSIKNNAIFVNEDIA